jgi:hypothetical protein
MSVSPTSAATSAEIESLSSTASNLADAINQTLPYEPVQPVPETVQRMGSPRRGRKPHRIVPRIVPSRPVPSTPSPKDTPDSLSTEVVRSPLEYVDQPRLPAPSSAPTTHQHQRPPIALELLCILEKRAGNGSLPTLYYGTTFHPVLFYDGRRVLLSELMDGPLRMVRNEILRAAFAQTLSHYVDLENQDDPLAKIYLDPGNDREALKVRLLEAFPDPRMYRPPIQFLGTETEDWTFQSPPVPEPVLSEGPIAQGDIPGPSLSQHVIPDNWTEAHVSIPQKASIERILQKVGEIYVTDEELMEDIMRLLTLISDFSFCSTADRIIRFRLADPHLTDLWEILVNTRRASYLFKDEASAEAHILFIIDVTVRLIRSGIMHYISDFVRQTTAGFHGDNQDLSNNPQRRYGILLPAKPFWYLAPNSDRIRNISAAARRIDVRGGLDYDQVLAVKREADALLYEGEWDTFSPEAREYVDSAIAIMKHGIPLWGIDEPQWITQNQVDAQSDRRYFYRHSATLVLPHSNRHFYECGKNKEVEPIGCLQCGRHEHYTCEHYPGYRVHPSVSNQYRTASFLGPQDNDPVDLLPRTARFRRNPCKPPMEDDTTSYASKLRAKTTRTPKKKRTTHEAISRASTSSAPSAMETQVNPEEDIEGNVPIARWKFRHRDAAKKQILRQGSLQYDRRRK